ncbi:MAG: AgmX/PglI C-terminal domain-containing protein [Deltaproteobacteria bacterium]|nr:AgmX/PglI C-terminal domain-containing protein [Deltaproteobacteria bacterium]
MLLLIALSLFATPDPMQHELPTVGPAKGVAVSSIDVPADGRFVDLAGKPRVLYVHKGAGLVRIGRAEMKLNAERAVVVPAAMAATLTTSETMQIVRFELPDPADVKEPVIGRRDHQKKRTIPLARGFANADPMFAPAIGGDAAWQLTIVDATEDAVVRLFSGEKGGEVIVPLSGKITVRREGGLQAREPFTAYVCDPSVAHRIVTDGHARWIVLASAHTMAMLDRDRAHELANGFGGVEAEGALDAYEVQQVVEKGVSGLNACYKDALGDDRYFAGELRARFTVKANGKVKDVKMEHASVGNLSVQQCIARVIGGLEFPKSKTKQATLVSYPFILSP